MALMLFWQLQTVSNVVTIVSAFYNIDRSSEAIAEASAGKDVAFDDGNANYTKHKIAVCPRTLRSIVFCHQHICVCFS